jgi:hypothetical protein
MAVPEPEDPVAETDLPAEIPTERAFIEEHASLIQRTSRASRRFTLPGAELFTRDHEDEELDDAFYADVREAMGHGTPSLLLGTSTRALDRSLTKIMAAQRAAHQAEPEPISESEQVLGPLPPLSSESPPARLTISRQGLETLTIKSTATAGQAATALRLVVLMLTVLCIVLVTIAIF